VFQVRGEAPKIFKIFSRRSTRGGGITLLGGRTIWERGEERSGVNVGKGVGVRKRVMWGVREGTQTKKGGHHLLK
jgi:hypothetical protein